MSQEGSASEGGLLVEEVSMRTSKSEVFPSHGSEDEEEIFSFVGDAISINDGSVLRLFFNNCNGLEVNELIKGQVQERFRKKDKKYLGEDNCYSKCESIIATMSS